MLKVKNKDTRKIKSIYSKCMIQKLKQLVKFVQRLYKRDTRRISEKKKCSYWNISPVFSKDTIQALKAIRIICKIYS